MEHLVTFRHLWEMMMCSLCWDVKCSLYFLQQDIQKVMVLHYAIVAISKSDLVRFIMILPNLRQLESLFWRKVNFPLLLLPRKYRYFGLLETQLFLHNHSRLFNFCFVVNHPTAQINTADQYITVTQYCQVVSLRFFFKVWEGLQLWEVD